MKKTFILIAAIVMLATGACKKKTEDPLTRKQILTGHSWLYVSLTKNGNNVALFPCEKDDSYSFYTDGKGVYEHGPVLCSGESAFPDAFTYTVSADEKYLSLTGANGSGSLEIVTIDATKMVLRQVDGINIYENTYNAK